MPNFQAAITLTPPSASQCFIGMLDASNYTTNTQHYHGLVYFGSNSYFKVTVVRPDSSEYVYSNVGGDVAVPAPSTTIFNTIYNPQPTDVNGDYTVRLCTVPQWTVADPPVAGYSNTTNDVVYLNGQLWACTVALADPNNPPSPSNSEWLAITEETLEGSYPQYCIEEQITLDCLPSQPFQATFTDPFDALIDLDVDEECSRLQIVDNANYATNDEVGHNIADFSDYRKLTLIRGDGTPYVYSSLGDGDDVIAAPNSGNHTVNYTFMDTDVDGIYEAQVCAYPTWNDSVSYGDAPSLIVVYYDGNLYRSLQASTAAQPDISPDDWELYEPTPEEELATRYCTIAKIAVLCIELLKCRERITHKAFCLMDSDFCNDDVLCKNKDFLGATKLFLTFSAMESSVNRQAWKEVEAQMNFAKTICNCC